MKIKKIIDHASKLYQAMDWKEFDDKTKRVIITERSGAVYEELLDLTFKVNDEIQLSDDSTYEFTMEALGMIADTTATNEDELREAGYEMEADCYTSDLTNWLNQSNYHVYFLTEVLEEMEFKDGFNLLATAQQKAKQEVFNLVLDYLIEKERK